MVCRQTGHFSARYALVLLHIVYDARGVVCNARHASQQMARLDGFFMASQGGSV